MKNAADHTLSFEHLTNIFSKKENSLFTLKPEAGTGFLTISNLENGLKARFWDCEFTTSMKLHNGEARGKPYYNLAFFPSVATYNSRMAAGT